MSDLIKKPYEISVWEDVLTFIDSSGNFHTTIDDSVSSQIIAQFYDERKICIIGSDTMSSPIRVVEPTLVSGINGSCTLTFSLYYKYYDEETEQSYDNPYIKFLVNERKIKLRHGAPDDPACKWYDLVIKNIAEDSEDNKFVYTAKSLFLNELSKSGFDLEFDPKLENSNGTIEQLAREILKGSDWQLADDCSTLLQYIEEPLYKLKLRQEISGEDMLTGRKIGPIQSGQYIYVFYSHLANKDQSIQFLYNSSDYATNEDRVIVNAPSSNLSDKGSNYLLTTPFSYTETDYGNRPSIAETMELVSEYRGARLVRKPRQIYDKILDRYVYSYTKDGEDYYGYEDTSYQPPMAVGNYITSPRDFIDSKTGWRIGGVIKGEETVYPKFEARAYPDIYGSNAVLSEATLNFKFTDLNQAIYNSGLRDNRSAIKTITKNEKYVFRIELKQESGGSLTPVGPGSLFKVQIGGYELEDGVYTIPSQDLIFDFSNTSWIRTEALEERYDTQGNVTMVKRVFYHAIAESKKSVSLSEMLASNLGIFIRPLSGSLNKEYFITEAQFFPYVEGESENVKSMCVPGELYEPQVETYYYYYPKDHTFNSPEDYKYTDKSLTPVEAYELVYYNADDTENSIESGYEKIRSITASESNRFNLLQTLCETFECWLDFRIEHEPSGKISSKFLYEIETEEGCKYEESSVFSHSNTRKCIGKRQQKFISFKEFIGRDNPAGFRYGINLKGIKRTIDSEGIVSKIIVKDNSNEYAPGGFCSISRSKANPSTENFLYNFTYYINQGLLGINQVTNDLYSSGFNGYLGYYTNLARLNSDRDALIEEQVQLKTALTDAQSQVTFYTTSITSAEENSVNEKLRLKQTASPFTYDIFMILTMEQTEDLDAALSLGKESWNSWIGLNRTQYENLQKIAPEIAREFTDSGHKGTKESVEEAYELVHDYRTWKKSNGIIQSCNKILNYDRTAAAHRQLLENAKKAYSSLESRSTEIKEVLTERLIQKERLHKSFYNKYSRFIQEGSWISEDYIDDELYYLDAESTLYTSSQPMISYDIEVLELSGVEGYENYSFGLGDKTYVEDTEFFGWYFDPISGAKTPYKEEVIVSEVTINLDAPENNRLKVQNYKTQFEDLFQRVTATTQSIEYSTGQYDKAAAVVQPNGTLTFSTLQNSIANNALVLQNAKDQSVVWDESGITTTCLTKPSEVVRIVSGGIFLSKDGGSTWQTGVTGNGINASYLTSGQIDTNVIRIMNGIHASFRWDNMGLTAYQFTPLYDAAGAIGGGQDFKPGVFTRFDQYGLYGISNDEDFDASKPTEKGLVGEEKIWEAAKFAMTWKGFSLRSDGTKGYIRISSTDDIQVLTNVNNKLVARVKIGDLSDGAGERYGMRIKDDNGATVLETDDRGLLYLQRYIRIGANAYDNDTDRVKFGIVEDYKLVDGVLQKFADGEGHDQSTVALSKLLSVKDTGLSVKADSLNLDDEEVLSIFDDGTILAKRVIINGGRIGNMTIDEIEQLNLKVVIEIIEGNDAIFRNSQPTDSKTLRARLSNGNRFIDEMVGKTLSYYWTLDGKEELGRNKDVEITAGKITSSTGAGVVRCVITVTDNASGQTLDLS